MEVRKISGRLQVCTGLLLVATGLVVRLLPHAPNVAPVGALAVFAGAALSWRAGLAVPLGIMALSDCIIGLYSGVPYTWLGFGLAGLYGAAALRHQPFLRRSILGALGGGIIFYLVSNFGVWLQSGMYAHTWQGLLDCYTLALPFFRNSLLADAAYLPLLFTVHAAGWRLLQRRLSSQYRAAP